MVAVQLVVQQSIAVVHGTGPWVHVGSVLPVISKPVVADDGRMAGWRRGGGGQLVRNF